MRSWRWTPLVAVGVLGGGLSPQVAAAAVPHTGTASVRIVDHYKYGKLVVTIEAKTYKVAPGDRTRFFSVHPDPSGNDGVTLTPQRAPGCGLGTASRLFKAGKSYRLVVKPVPHSGRCTDHGKSVGATPGFKVVHLH